MKRFYHEITTASAAGAELIAGAEKTALENFVTYRTNKRDNTVELFYRRWNGTPTSCTWSIDRECWVN